LDGIDGLFKLRLVLRQKDHINKKEQKNFLIHLSPSPPIRIDIDNVFEGYGKVYQFG